MALLSFFSVPRANGLSVDEVQFQYDLDTASDASSDILLPASYMEIQPCFLPSKDPVIPCQEVFLDFTDFTAAHVKRTRYTHTVTTAALFNNLREMYENYCNSETGDAISHFCSVESQQRGGVSPI